MAVCASVAPAARQRWWPDCGAAGGLEDWLVKAYDGEVLVEVRAGGLGHADRDPFGSSIFEYLEVILTARRTHFDAMRAAQT